MKIEQVKKMKPLERLLYWIEEREAIRLKKEAGEDKPWTNDTILQSTYFTNVNREQDKVTVWLRENIREPLRDDPKVFFAVLAFRWFNYIPTGHLLRYGRPEEFGKGGSWKDKIDLCYLCDWKLREVVLGLNHYKEKYGKVFTGAFNISNSGSTKPKINRVCEDYIQPVWEERKRIKTLLHNCALGQAHQILMECCPGLGGSGFMAGQIIADLKHTYLLENATDWWTWCSPGPGSKRGMNRVHNLHPNEAFNKREWLPRINQLREVIKEQTGMKVCAQDCQSILCETDKFNRILNGEGRSKRTYPGVSG